MSNHDSQGTRACVYNAGSSPGRPGYPAVTRNSTPHRSLSDDLLEHDEVIYMHHTAVADTHKTNATNNIYKSPFFLFILKINTEQKHGTT